jgi:L-methionine (R)-S-oxide reductase
MAEIIPDLRGVPKARAYDELQAHGETILEGIADEIAGMATISSLVHNAFGYLWTGFYRVVEPGALLRVGPYQGSLGCLEIAFGRGVCGTAAAERRTVIVPDVEKFPGHIACDSRSRSEIVVPVLDKKRDLIAVLDIDSEQLDSFDEDDQRGLEKMVSWFASTERAR